MPLLDMKCAVLAFRTRDVKKVTVLRELQFIHLGSDGTEQERTTAME